MSKSEPSQCPPLLEVDHPEFLLGKGAGATHLPFQTVVRLHPGERLVLMGPSGGGKSTLLNAILGRITPRTGEMRVGGHTCGSAEAFRWLVEHASIVFQENALFDGKTVEQNLRFSLRNRGLSSAEISKRVTKALQSVGLGEKSRSKPVKALSGGQKRRVALARGLVTQPRLLLLDEPTSGLDPFTTREVAQYLKEISEHQGIAIFCINHDDEFAGWMDAPVWHLEAKAPPEVHMKADAPSEPVPNRKGWIVPTVRKTFATILRLFAANAAIALPASALVGAALVAQSLSGPSWMQQVLPKAIVAGVFLGLGTLVPTLLMIGLTASATTAEIVQQRHNKLLDYLSYLNLPPRFYIAIPVISGFLVCVPIVIVLSEVAMLYGGRVLLQLMEHRSRITALKFETDVKQLADLQLFTDSILKGISHGLVIGIVILFCSFRAAPGEQGLRSAIRNTVLAASALVVISDLAWAFF